MVSGHALLYAWCLDRGLWLVVRVQKEPFWLEWGEQRASYWIFLPVRRSSSSWMIAGSGNAAAKSLRPQARDSLLHTYGVGQEAQGVAKTFEPQALWARTSNFRYLEFALDFLPLQNFLIPSKFRNFHVFLCIIKTILNFNFLLSNFQISTAKYPCIFNFEKKSEKVR